MSKEIRKLAEAALNDIHVKGFRSSMAISEFASATGPREVVELLNSHEAEVKALTARVAELEAALKPFAEEAQRYEPDDGDSNMPAWSSNEFCIGHFRRAAAAMEGK